MQSNDSIFPFLTRAGLSDRNLPFRIIVNDFRCSEFLPANGPEYIPAPQPLQLSQSEDSTGAAFDRTEINDYPVIYGDHQF